MHKVSAGGSYRLDKRFPAPVGRLALASGATTRAAYRNVVACLDRLAERGRLDVLRALKDQAVTIAQVLDADRRAGLDALMTSLTPAPEQASLWEAIERWLGPVPRRNLTVKRYAVSLAKLQRLAPTLERSNVEGLASMDWKGLREAWDGSGADWNHCRRAVSRFLTVHLDDVYHPLRRAVVKAFPKRAETERVPDLDVATFWQVVQATPEHVRPALVTLVALGLRVGEYLRLRETDLHPITKTVNIPGTKTEGSAAVLAVSPDLWPWVVAAVPSPVGYKWLRLYWKRALKAIGADVTLRLQDLRHLPAQLLVSDGQSEASVQGFMRHASPDMTRRYAKQRDRGENAAALARVLGLPQFVPQSPVALERVAR